MGWAVEGRPADCVKLALLELLPEPPDLIVSGLNAGANAGINVLYSGTVAAAIEGAFFQVPSIAVSLEYSKPKPLNFPQAADIARGVIAQILGHAPSGSALFNVNIPSLEKGPILGVRVMPQNVAPYLETFDRRVDPRRPACISGLRRTLAAPIRIPETDVIALAEGYVTVTPLQFNLTDAVMLEKMKAWEWTLPTSVEA